MKRLSSPRTLPDVSSRTLTWRQEQHPLGQQIIAVVHEVEKLRAENYVLQIQIADYREQDKRLAAAMNVILLINFMKL